MLDIRRREFITLLGGAAAWPLVARAQQSERMRRIGVILGNIETDPEAQVRIGAFRQRLAELGWIEGRNVSFDYRFGATDPDRIRSLVRELVDLGPDVILGAGTPIAVALKKQTRTIPIVFALVGDPVASGLVASLARPGENMTGLTNYEYAMGGKWVETLKESAPPVTRVLAIQNPANATAPGLMRAIEAAARSLGLQITTASTLDVTVMEQAIGAFAREPNGGLIVLPDATTTNLRESLVALAARYRLPAIYPFRYFAESGGLISYGIDTADEFRLAAGYVSRILKGEKPADLPVQAPTKFELVINLKTAQALGLDLPPFLQQRADEVIE
jgi:putative tryptophan/tyrosine transport system substrate-binding protein